MAQSAPKVCAARVWRQGFVSSDPVILPTLQLWHVKCVSEGRSSTYLPGHGLARCFSRLWAGPFRSCSVLTDALSVADAKRRLHPVGCSGADADDRLRAMRAPWAIQRGKAGRKAGRHEASLPVGHTHQLPEDAVRQHL
jgi:hypothetical protein